VSPLGEHAGFLRPLIRTVLDWDIARESKPNIPPLPCSTTRRAKSSSGQMTGKGVFRVALKFETPVPGSSYLQSKCCECLGVFDDGSRESGRALPARGSTVNVDGGVIKQSFFARLPCIPP